MEEILEIRPLQDEVLLEDDQMRQMILAIKKTRIEKHLTYTNIVEGCAENGEPVSMTSVRRVCADGSENQKFRYEGTLRPIARFVLGLDDAPMPEQAVEEDGPAANELLRLVLNVKESTIADMKQGIQQREDELTRVRADHEARAAERNRTIDFLKNSVAEKDDEIRQLKKTRLWLIIAVVILGILMVLSMIVTISYLSWDFTHPTQGVFQWETSALP